MEWKADRCDWLGRWYMSACCTTSLIIVRLFASVGDVVISSYQSAATPKTVCKALLCSSVSGYGSAIASRQTFYLIGIIFTDLAYIIATWRAQSSPRVLEQKYGSSLTYSPGTSGGATLWQSHCMCFTITKQKQCHAQQNYMLFRLWSHPTCWRYINKSIIIARIG